MSLQHAILALLKEEPMSGYDLKTSRFDRKVSHFWSADQAQIYRTLDKLEDLGWVESQLEIQYDHPNRKVYRITTVGETELHRWLQEFQPLTVRREPFLIQLFFGSGLSNQALLVLLENQLEAHEERLKNYEQVSLNLPDLADKETNRALTLHRLTLEGGLKTEKATIEWLKHCIEIVKTLKE
jgi:PadR family transcriptional regulator, regulatory protein AphA